MKERARAMRGANRREGGAAHVCRNIVSVVPEHISVTPRRRQGVRQRRYRRRRRFRRTVIALRLRWV